MRCNLCWGLFRWDYFGSRLLEVLTEGTSPPAAPPTHAHRSFNASLGDR